MFKIKNKFYRIIISCVAVFLVGSALFFHIDLNSFSVMAQASTLSSSNEVNEISLDSDLIQGYSDYTIRDYTTHLHATDASVQVNDNNEYELYRMFLDDSIVRIVPKEYFFKECNQLDMGTEYGYFIHTELEEEGYYTSVVIVFDILVDTDREANNGNVITTVDTLFEYEYKGLVDRSGSLDVYGVTLSYDGLLENRVMAYPSNGIPD